MKPSPTPLPDFASGGYAAGYSDSTPVVQSPSVQRIRERVQEKVREVEHVSPPQSAQPPQVPSPEPSNPVEEPKMPIPEVPKIPDLPQVEVPAVPEIKIPALPLP